MIKTVTITGADDSVDYTELAKLSEEFPFVEWGILFSAKQVGTSRFPSLEWLRGLRDLHERGLFPKLSMHLCGRFVKNFLVGEFDFIDVNLQSLWPMFKRVQLNTHGEPHEWKLELVEQFIAANPDKEFIFQYDEVNTDLIEGLGKRDKVENISTLFDLSHGAGISPKGDQWPVPLNWIKCGYAGGLGPDNLHRQCLNILHKLSGTLQDKPDREIWIDMETKVRTEVPGMAMDRFDLDKVRQCLEIAKPFVR